MPSPFPGMDPFLENPELFPGFHDRMVTYLAEDAQPRLPEPYLADIGRRAWMEVSERYVQPDVEVMRPRGGNAGSVRETGGAIAVQRGTAAEPIVIHVPQDERREPLVEIYIGRGRERRLVTIVEVLSPSNKTNGDRGRESYLRKQREILESEVNLVEIDLLRSGRHATAVPSHRLRQKAPAYDYHVCIRRFNQPEDLFVYAIHLEERLPTIPLPLLPDDGSIEVDLQAVFNRCYDAGPYPREIDYEHDKPEPPLTPGQQAWAERLLTHD